MNQIKEMIDNIEDKEVLRNLMRERKEAKKKMQRGENEKAEDLQAMIN